MEPISDESRQIMAYIPARGGSKRIPRKNIRPLGGIPVMAHVIRCLRALPFVGTVCVSTDDDEIAAVAVQEGAVTLGARAAALSDDFTSVVDLLARDVPRFFESCGMTASDAELLITFPTAALLTPNLLSRARREYLQQRTPLLFAAQSYDVSPFRSLTLHPDGTWRPLFPDGLIRRTQDQPEARADAGLFYFLNFARVTTHPGHWFTHPEGVSCFPVDPEIAIDVDTPADWQHLEGAFAACSKRL